MQTDDTTRAHELLDTFAAHTRYRHGDANPHLARLRAATSLERERVIAFLCTWWSFSRRTPQILLNAAAAYPEWSDRGLIMQNYLEEDGRMNPGDEPHYDLLERLIHKLGGTLTINPAAEKLIGRLMRLLGGMTAARATGVVSGFEHPALDITNILLLVVEKAGFAELLETDIYLTIHVAVEPSHIVWAHGCSLRYMKMGSAEYAEVLSGFQDTMDFWSCFWDLAMADLFAPADEQEPVRISDADDADAEAQVVVAMAAG